MYLKRGKESDFSILLFFWVGGRHEFVNAFPGIFRRWLRRFFMLNIWFRLIVNT
jgi:hypothetical protein